MQDLQSMGDSVLTHLFIQGDMSKSKNEDLLAQYKLKSLVIRKGRLEEIPEWVFRIKTLETLDLGDNYLAELNGQICQMLNLKELILWVNDLHNLPFCINEMVELRRIDMTGIKLNDDDQRNLKNSFRGVNFIFSEPCLCNFGKDD